MAWPQAWVMYPVIAVVAETALHVLPLAGLVWLTRSRFYDLRLTERTWALVLSALRGAFRVSSSARICPSTWPHSGRNRRRVVARPQAAEWVRWPVSGRSRAATLAHAESRALQPAAARPKVRPDPDLDVLRDKARLTVRGVQAWVDGLVRVDAADGVAWTEEEEMLRTVRRGR